MVKSFGDEQYCGCTGFPADSHVTKWLTVQRRASFFENTADSGYRFLAVARLNVVQNAAVCIKWNTLVQQTTRMHMSVGSHFSSSSLPSPIPIGLLVLHKSYDTRANEKQITMAHTITKSRRRSQTTSRKTIGGLSRFATALHRSGVNTSCKKNLNVTTGVNWDFHCSHQESQALPIYFSYQL